MALIKATSRSRWYRIGHDKGKDVFWEIEPIPASEDRELRRQALGDTKARKAANQTAVKQLERYEDYAAVRACRAVKNSKNFFLELGTDEAVATYCPLLGIEAKAGEEVCLDGKWTDALKERIFDDFPKLAGKASDLAEAILQGELEEEEEATEAF